VSITGVLGQGAGAVEGGDRLINSFSCAQGHPKVAEGPREGLFGHGCVGSETDSCFADSEGAVHGMHPLQTGHQVRGQ
jgi:hypothetical protein